jgi:hypothetical protein
MTKEKELGYKLGDVIWHNLEGYQELWNKADFDTKEKIINELGRLAIELTIPIVVGQSEQLKMLEHIRHVKGLPLDVQITIDKMYLSHL